tara:strand:+ start:166 stop:486 length:321 start_codon:yes stop_codon:yes gene_type:complete
MIQVTDKAKNYLLEATTSNDKKYVKFSVKGGGCSGFKYEWDFLDDKEGNFIEVDLTSGKQLLIEPIAEMYIMGSTIDYITELGGSYLTVRNPMATASCGCGESFAV